MTEKIYNSKPKSTLMMKVKNNVMQIFKFFLILYFLNFFILLADENNSSGSERDHEKAIKAVNEGEILPLDEILKKVENEFAGRIISVNLKDNEKGLFGWVYDIMIIGIDNNEHAIKLDFIISKNLYL